MYGDEIEKSLSKFESEVAPIIKKLATDKCIVLSKEDDEKLKVFFALMTFRNKDAKTFFTSEMSDNDKKIYYKYQKDCNYENLWKKNVGLIAVCRSYEEIENNQLIDFPIKVFMKRDIKSLYGTHFRIWEKLTNENEKFILGNFYPVVIKSDFCNLHMFSYFPLSPSRILVLISNGVEGVPDDVGFFKKKLCQTPSDDLNIKTQKIYKKGIRKINNDIISNSKEGIVFTDKRQINLYLKES